MYNNNRGDSTPLLSHTVSTQPSYREQIHNTYQAYCAWFAKNKVLLYSTSAVTTLIPFIQATFSFFVFTGFLDCGSHNHTGNSTIDEPYSGADDMSANDRLFYILYYSLIAASGLLNVPNVLIERFRKSAKPAAYLGIGTAKPLFAPSPKWIKTMNTGLAYVSTFLTGWNFSSMFAGGFPPNEANLQCVHDGWSMSARQVGISLAGAAASVALGAPQAATYLGRAKPLFGKVLTALSYAIFKIAMTLYPIVRKIVKSGGDFNWQSDGVKLVAAVIITLNRFVVYKRTNDVIDITMSLNLDEDHELGELKKRITSLKGNLARLQKSKIKDKTFIAQKNAMKATIKRLELEFQKKLKAYNTIRVNKKLNTENITSSKNRNAYLKVFLALNAVAGSAAVAYITTKSLHAIAAAFNFDTEQNEWSKILVWVAACLYAHQQLFKFILGIAGPKQLDEQDYENTLSTIKTRLNENYQACIKNAEDQLNQLIEKLPPPNSMA